ncbi:MAG: hypothetical protein OES38_03130 [Gammaproteobacteria bacterium]|nr:hypothetical protein [Gammaproteobacteria bacterium]
MKPTPELILQYREDPDSLERLYRANSNGFSVSLPAALAQAPDSLALRVWNARLSLAHSAPAGDAGHAALWWVIAIGLAVALLVRLPTIWISGDWFYPRFAPMLVLISLAAYFLSSQPRRPLIAAGAGLALLSAIYVSLLPDYTDSIIMSLIHLPLFLGAYVGLVFVNGAWRDPLARVQFARYVGELAILGSLVLLGGMVLSGLSMGLFSLIDDDIVEWWLENIVVMGMAATLVVATYLYDVVFNRRSAIATVLARVFAPLFLVVVVGYLVAAFTAGSNPFVDRSFLITFNGLLLVVLAITVFSLVERDRESAVGLADYVNLGLVGTTLLINVIALSAILFRLASYGFTPNRVTVLGANLVIFIHLVWIGFTYLKLARNKVEFEAMERVIGRYIPVYGCWSAFVVFVLPLLFQYD